MLDAFGDLDMREAAKTWRTIPIDPDWRFDSRMLVDAANRLAPPPAPLVWGSGLAGSPDLLARLAHGRPLAGSTPELVRGLAEPAGFAALCARLDIPHPETRTDLRSGGPGWLVKRQGGSGGNHIRAGDGTPIGCRDYLQRAVPGRPVSALLLGRGEEAQVLGFSEQWPSPGPGRPFRFAGVAAPAALDAGLIRELAFEAARLAAAVGLRGLASADFVYDEASGRHWLLEVNPRPGASLEAWELLLGQSLLPLHLEACAGRLPGQLPPMPEGRAAATQIVYAPAATRLPASLDWPAWAGDRGPPGTAIPAGAPICTARAVAATVAAAREAVAHRTHQILAMLAPEPIGQWAAGAGLAIDGPSERGWTRNEGVR